jgi:hypothetical protein
MLFGTASLWLAHERASPFRRFAAKRLYARGPEDHDAPSFLIRPKATLL